MQHPRQCTLFAKNPNLFSDDLFADDDNRKDNVAEKRKNYLEENWDVNPEDRDALRSFGDRRSPKPRPSSVKQAKGQRSGDPEIDSIMAQLEKNVGDLEREFDLPFDLDSNETIPAYPVFVLNYVFKEEYAEIRINASITEHKNYAAGFKRLLSSNIMNYKPNGADKPKRGMSLVFVGLSDGPNEREETFEDIQAFIADDPLILQDIVGKWDIDDMNEDDDEEDEGDEVMSKEEERAMELLFKHVVGMNELTDDEQRELDEARISHPEWFFDEEMEADESAEEKVDSGDN